jgi:DNA-binding NarL/FixJ family response regulator
MFEAGGVRVLVVDDHATIRWNLRNLIDGERPRLCVVGTAGTADEALLHARQLKPQVVVLDVNLAGEDGLSLMPALRALACEVVVLTSLTDPRVEFHAMRLGAFACVHKTAPAAQLLACIDATQAQARTPGLPGPVNTGGGSAHATGTKLP